jgi:hypothetical protein
VETPLIFLRKFYALDWKKLAKRNPRGAKRFVFKSFSFLGLFILAYASLLEVERIELSCLADSILMTTCLSSSFWQALMEDAPQRACLSLISR